MKIISIFSLFLFLTNCSSKPVVEGRSISSDSSIYAAFFSASSTNIYPLSNFSDIDLKSLKVSILDGENLHDEVFNENSLLLAVSQPEVSRNTYYGKNGNIVLEEVVRVMVEFKIYSSQKYIALTKPQLAKKGQVIRVDYILKR